MDKVNIGRVAGLTLGGLYGLYRLLDYGTSFWVIVLYVAAVFAFGVFVVRRNWVR